MYIDGYVIPVPRKKMAAYKRHSLEMSKITRSHGAIDHIVAVADDVKKGTWTSFPQSVKLKAGEIVVFAYVTFKSRAARDLCMNRVMKDPRVHAMWKTSMPFDGKRMFWGGFKPIVN